MFITAFNSADAQGPRISAAAELALPLGDFSDAYSLEYGASVAGEPLVGHNIEITVTAGYIMLAVSDDLKDLVKNSAMIPVQAGAKYYFNEQQSGVYGQAQVGIHSVSITTEDIDLGPILGTIEGETESDSNFSFAFGAGYFLNENINLSIRYYSITSSEDEVDASSYIGLRAAYKF